MVHATLVERIITDVHAARQAVFLAQALGAKAEAPTIDEAVDAFEAHLCGEPKTLDPDELDLREALGLRGHRG